jgi:hypothetical protein
MAMNTTTKNAKLISLAALLLGAASCGVDGPANDPAPGVAAVTPASPSCTGDWVQVDSPNVGGSDNALAAVAGTTTNDIWAVGQFSPDANPNTPNVGTNHGNALLAVAAEPGVAWAVGYDIGTDYLSHSLIEAWDGHAWSIVDHPHPFETENLYGVAAVSASDVWAVGSGRNDQGDFQAFTLHFDGHHWSNVTAANPGTNGNVLYAVVANASNDVWAVGQKIGDAPPDQALLEHWNGRRWTEVPSGVSVAPSAQLIGVDAVGGDDVRAVGDAQDGVVSLRTFGLSGEGTHFTLQGTPDPNTGDNRLTGVAAVGDDESWAVGSTLDGASGNLLTLIATGGEGSAWTQVASPSPGFDNGDSQLATLTKVGKHDLWAVGGFDGPAAAQTLVLHRCR